MENVENNTTLYTRNLYGKENEKIPQLIIVH